MCAFSAYRFGIEEADDIYIVDGVDGEIVLTDVGAGVGGHGALKGQFHTRRHDEVVHIDGDVLCDRLLVEHPAPDAVVAPVRVLADRTLGAGGGGGGRG